MMNKEDKQFLEGLLIRANQSGKKETSGLVDDVKGFHQEIKTELQGVNKRLDTLNGSVAKQQDKLAQHDIINAQVTLTQKQTTDTLAVLLKSSEENTVFRVGAEANLSAFKWLFGFLGIGNVIMFAKVVLGLF